MFYVIVIQGSLDAICSYFIWFDKEEVHGKDEKVAKLEDFI
jgi:hypothetical protein